MVSISRSLPAPRPRAEPIDYRTYLGPVLYRRLAKASLITMLLSYGAALVMGNLTIWSFTPASVTFVRFLGLYLGCAMPVGLLHIAQLHLDVRRPEYTWGFVRQRICSLGTWAAALVYMISSLVFMEIYRSTSSKSLRLHVVTEARSYERPRLNERALYLWFFAFVHNGLALAINYIFNDSNKLTLDNSMVSYVSVLVRNARRALVLAGVSSISGIITYWPVRASLWTLALGFFRNIYWLNRSTTLPLFPVGVSLIFRTLWLSFWVCLLTEGASYAFLSSFAENPFTPEKTITDQSPDPNGTLLTGLRASGKPLTQTLAFWELSILAAHRPDRRKAIFRDVNPKTSMWELILNECLQVIGDVEVALSQALSANKPSDPAPTTPAPEPHSEGSLPSSPPVRMSPAQALVTAPSPRSRQLVEKFQATEIPKPAAVLTRKLPSVDASLNFTAFKNQMLPFIESPTGKFFRQTIQSTTDRLLPNVRIPIDAITALTDLICASLEEDEYGVVQQHVGAVLETFSSTLSTIESFTSNPPLDWTDVEAKKAPRGTIVLDQPEQLKKALVKAIGNIVKAYDTSLDEVTTPDLKTRLLMTVGENS